MDATTKQQFRFVLAGALFAFQGRLELSLEEGLASERQRRLAEAAFRSADAFLTYAESTNSIPNDR